MRFIRRRYLCAFLWGFIFITSILAPAHAGSQFAQTSGETVYVPIYTHYFSSAKNVTQTLVTTVVMRNTDLQTSVNILSAALYNSKGQKLDELLTGALVLAPLASKAIVLRDLKIKDGLGASVIIKWKSEKMVNAPRFESVMIGTRAQQGISFVFEGWPIRE